jgi:hypothetical protein
MTREFRFKPAPDSNDVTRILLSSENTTDRLAAIVIQPTASYSGSSEYGRILYGHYIGSGITITGSTQWLPLYDGDVWNIRWWYETTGAHYNTGSNTNTTYHIQVQKASDYINGKVIHSSNLSVTPTVGSHTLGWATPGSSRMFIGDASGTDLYSLDSTFETQFGTSGTIKQFIGYVQEYREWLETLDQATFDDHTLNPTSYVSSLSPTSSYDTLIRHYPLGSDTIGRSHVSNAIISSSHPANHIKNFGGRRAEVGGNNNTNIGITGAAAPSDPEIGNYIGVTETYYVPGVSLGGSLPRSEKIRLEDNYLVRRLSPTNTAERSSFDYAPLDTNRVGLFYSHADQINKDIFNQIGDIALDDYVGDPNDEFGYQYPDLFHFSKNYWKKYTDRNDVNAYIRIFSQFDFSLFNQIKQLLPARVDEAMGLLIEPHALERVKVPLTKRPVVENPQYSVTLTQSQPTASGEYIMYSASIAVADNLVLAESVYHSGSNGYSDLGNTWFANMDVGPTDIPTDYCGIAIYPADARPSATASLFDAFYKPTIDSYGNGWFTNTTLLDSLKSTNGAYATSSILSTTFSDQLFTRYTTGIQYDAEYSFTVNVISSASFAFPNTSILAGVNVMVGYIDENNIITPIQTIDKTQQYISILPGFDIRFDAYKFSNIKVNAYSDLVIALRYRKSSNSTVDFKIFVDNIGLTFEIQNLCHIGVHKTFDTYRTSNIFQQVVYHYSGSGTNLSLRDRNAQHAYSQSLGLYYSQSLIPATYMDDQFDQYENARYNGCRISSPDFNINSTVSAIGNSPVIEVYNTNPNQLIFTQNPESRGGTGTTEPGNLIVR